MSLKGQVAIVTGASTGAGRAYALTLAAAGCVVVAAARTLGNSSGDPQRHTLREVEAAASGLPGRVVGRICDVTDEASVVSLFAFALQQFGRVDILVNNAGAYLYGDLLEATGADWSRTMDLNLRGAFFTSREAVKAMIAQGGGAIVNITSAAADVTRRGQAAHDELCLYAISKAGLNRMTTFMAEEFADRGVTVNALSPGWVDPKAFSIEETEPPRKPATPEAIGKPLLYLVDEARRRGETGLILHSDTFGVSWPGGGSHQTHTREQA